MKKALALLMSVLVAGLAMAASVPTNGTSVGAAIIPQGNFPSHAAYYGHGGWRSVATTNDLSLIDSTRMETGMACYVTGDAKLYVYTGSNWTEFAAGASTPTLQAVTAMGNTTSNGLVVINAAGQTSFVATAASGLANGNNTVAGAGAGALLTSGTANTIVGKGAGANLANGNFNTVMGNEALYRASASSINTAIGDFALHELTNGNYNTAIGAGAMKNVPVGADNHVIGPNIMADGISVNGNIGMGYIPIRNIRYGGHNVAFGSEALRWVYSNAYDNVAIGRFSLWNLGQFDWTNCSRNVAVGPYAGYNLASGDGNIFLGYYTLASSTSVSNEFVAGGVQQPIRNVWFGSGPNGTVPWTFHGEVATGLFNVVRANTVIVTNRFGRTTFEVPASTNANSAGMTIAGTGAGAALWGSSGISDNSTFYGVSAGAALTNGANNTFMGQVAGFSLAYGRRNTFIGQSAGYAMVVGDENTFIGKDCGQYANGVTNVIAIGLDAGTTSGRKDNILMGKVSAASGANATNEFVAGSPTFPIRDVYFGGGPGSVIPWTLHGEYASGLFLSLTENSVALSNKYAGLGTDNTYAGGTIQNFALATVTNNASSSTDVVNWRTMTNYVAGVTPASPNLQSVTTVGNLTSNGMIVVTAGGKTSLVINAASSTWAPAQGGVPEPRPTSTLIGYNVGGSMTSAVNNTLIGYEAGRDMQGGEHNVMVGDRAGVFSTNADENVFIGQSAGYVNGDGWYNVYVGREAGENNSGSNNTAIGHHAGRNGTYPSANPAYHNMTILGDSAGETTPGLRDNILMGVLAQASGANATNEFVAGSPTFPMLDVYFGGGPADLTTPWHLNGKAIVVGVGGIETWGTPNGNINFGNNVGTRDNSGIGSENHGLVAHNIGSQIVTGRGGENHGDVYQASTQYNAGHGSFNFGNLIGQSVQYVASGADGSANFGWLQAYEYQTNTADGAFNFGANNINTHDYSMNIGNGVISYETNSVSARKYFENGIALSNKYAALGTDNTYAGGTIQNFALATVTNNASASTDVVNWRTMTNYVVGTALSGYLKADGSVPVSGTFDMAYQSIKHVGIIGSGDTPTIQQGPVLDFSDNLDIYSRTGFVVRIHGGSAFTPNVTISNADVYATAYYENGVALASKYLQANGSTLWTGNQDANNTIITNLGGFWMSGVLVTNINTNAVSDLQASLTGVSNQVVALNALTNTETLASVTTRGGDTTASLSLRGNWMSFGFTNVGTAVEVWGTGGGQGGLLNLGYNNNTRTNMGRGNVNGGFNNGVQNIPSTADACINWGVVDSPVAWMSFGANARGSMNFGLVPNGGDYLYTDGKGSFNGGNNQSNTHDRAFTWGIGQHSQEADAMHVRKYFENGTALVDKYAALGTGNTYAGGTSQNFALATVTNNASASTDVVNYRTMTNYVLTANFLKADGSVLWTGNQNANSTIITNLGGFWLGGVLVTNIDTNAVADLEGSLTIISNQVVALNSLTNTETLASVAQRGSNTTASLSLNGDRNTIGPANGTQIWSSFTLGGVNLGYLSGTSTRIQGATGNINAGCLANETVQAFTNCSGGLNYGDLISSGSIQTQNTAFGCFNMGEVGPTGASTQNIYSSSGSMNFGYLNTSALQTMDSTWGSLNIGALVGSTQRITGGGDGNLNGGCLASSSLQVITGSGSMNFGNLTAGTQTNSANGAFILGGAGTNTHDYSVLLGAGLTSQETNSVNARKYFENGTALTNKYVSYAGLTNYAGNYLLLSGGTMTTDRISFTMPSDNVGFDHRDYQVVGQSQSVWMGYRALYNSSGAGNAGVGFYAGANFPGSFNTVEGYVALKDGAGSYNSAFGVNASYACTGSYNVAVGHQAGYLAGGVSNVFLGASAGTYGTATTLTNAVAIGAGAVPQGNNTVVLGNAQTLGVYAPGYYENGVALSNKYATYPAATNIVNSYIVGSGYMYMTENVGTSILYHVTLSGTHTNKLGEWYTSP